MSYLATLKFENGEYYDPSRSVQDIPLCLGNWKNAIGDVLGFCGCGSPETALLYVLKILRVLDEKGPDSWGPGGKDAWNEWYAAHRARLDGVFHGDAGAEYLAYYLLDNKNLTEHGGSVPGWLTGKGKDILADLEAHAAELEAESA